MYICVFSLIIHVFYIFHNKIHIIYVFYSYFSCTIEKKKLHITNLKIVSDILIYFFIYFFKRILIGFLDGKEKSFIFMTFFVKDA